MRLLKIGLLCTFVICSITGNIAGAISSVGIWLVCSHED